MEPAEHIYSYTKTRHRLPKRIAVMAQSPHLFNKTIKNNIRYGRPDATDSEVRDAAKKAGIHKRIMELPEQYETVVSEGGGYVLMIKVASALSLLTLTESSPAERSSGLRWHACLFKGQIS